MDLTNVAAYIEWQEERALDGKTATLEEYREHLTTGRHRAALEGILGAYNHDTLVAIYTAIHAPTEFEQRAMGIIFGIRNSITEALKESA